jgi:hypothetical protein
MSAYAPRVLLAELTERTSAAGNRYVSGFLGKARIIGLWGEGEDRDGNATTVLRLFVQEPEQHNPERQDRPGSTPPAAAERRREQRTQRSEAAAQARHEQAMQTLNDPIPL